MNEFSITLTLGNEVYKGVGKDAFEALSNLQKPTKIFVKGILKAEKGENKKEIVLNPSTVKRFFYPVSRRLFAKKLEFGM